MKRKNMAASVRARLLNQARATEQLYGELLQYYVMERFLYRLSQSPYNHQLILKGALVFMTWGAPHSRVTQDIDLLGFGNNSLSSIKEMIVAICQLAVEDDGVRFDINSITVQKIREDADYEGGRANLFGYIDTARIPLQIDIGFGDAIYPPPIMVDYPTLLDLPTPKVRSYQREVVIAEKYNAMVEYGIFNSRLKDYYDLWILATHFEFDKLVLARSIKNTFDQRGTIRPSDLPIGLSDRFLREKQTRWDSFVQKSRLNTETFEQVIGILRDFLQPFWGESDDESAVWRDGAWHST